MNINIRPKVSRSWRTKLWTASVSIKEAGKSKIIVSWSEKGFETKQDAKEHLSEPLEYAITYAAANELTICE